MVIIPPEAAWGPIQAIRKRYDRQIGRWMPHINLLYPFAPAAKWERILPRLTRACGELQPFSLRLEAFRHFKHPTGGYTLWLAPEPAGQLVALQQRLLNAAPGFDDVCRQAGGYTPHMSVGQINRREALERLLETLLRDWEPIEFEVRAISLIQRGDPPRDSFRIANRIVLGEEPAAGSPWAAARDRRTGRFSG